MCECEDNMYMLMFVVSLCLYKGAVYISNYLLASSPSSAILDCYFPVALVTGCRQLILSHSNIHNYTYIIEVLLSEPHIVVIYSM